MTYGAAWPTASGAPPQGSASSRVRKGDVFAIYSHNLPEYAVAFNAVASLGGVVTTANPLYTASELTKQLTDCRARFLLTAPPFLDKAREAAAAAGVEDIYVFGTADGARPFSELLDAPPDPAAVAIDPRKTSSCCRTRAAPRGCRKA